MMLVTGLITACQPTDSTQAIADTEAEESPNLIVNEDSVIITPEYILNIKTSRYQPSLGLQGVIEPIHQAQLTAAKDLYIQQVLVQKGQWVEKDRPLLIVEQQKQISDNRVIKTNSDKPDQETKDSLSEPLIDTISDSGTDDKANNHNTEDHQLAQTSMALTDKRETIVIRASFAGRVDHIYAVAGQNISSRQPLLHLSDDTDLRFIATLPVQAKSQLSVGQTVNFTATGELDKFTGQVSKLAISDKANQLLVHIHVVKNDASRDKLHPNTPVSGRVDYGQIKVGTIVPKHGIHDVDLTALKKPPYKPMSPLTANIWIINQDQRLTRQSVEVIEYNPITDQYLIAGISNDSLICLADLPLESVGKKVVVS